MQFINTEQTPRWIMHFSFVPTAESAALIGHVVHTGTAWRTTLKLRKLSTKRINLFSIFLLLLKSLIEYFTRENHKSSLEQSPPLGLKPNHRIIFQWNHEPVLLQAKPLRFSLKDKQNYIHITKMLHAFLVRILAEKQSIKISHIFDLSCLFHFKKENLSCKKEEKSLKIAFSQACKEV